MQDRSARQVKGVVEGRKPRHASRHHARTVIAAPARNDLLLFRAAKNVVVVPDQFNVGFIGIRTGQTKIDTAHMLGCTIDDHLGKRDRHLGAMADVGMVIGKLPSLFCNCIRNCRAAITNIDTIKTRKGIKALPAIHVGNVHTLAAFDHARWRFASRMHSHMGGRVEEMIAIPGGQFVAIVQHGYVPFLSPRFYAAVSMQRYLSSVKASMP
ncbi:hypothetical protein D3C80_483000 [compost metagenome]